MSSTDQPPAKRKRAEDPSAESAAPIPQVRSIVWYDDGNIILQAQDTLFKVHKGILAQNSSVFQDMFSLPQPPSVDTDLVEGCPVVQLSDTAEEVECVLQAICQREYVCFEELSTLPVISAFVRLGTKYDIPKLRIEGQRKIFKGFSTELDGPGTDGQSPWLFVKVPETWFDLVIFARTTGLLSILPIALYVCCQGYTTSEITEGIKRKDGTIVSLSGQDKLACLAGYQAICKAQAETTFSWAYTKPPPDECSDPTRCMFFRDQYLKLDFTSLPAIAGLDHFDKLGFCRTNLCSLCDPRSEEMHNTGRKAFWALLPSLFGLPPWEELCKEREDVK
ncbi:hypothetical protein FIBSPDRAFT_794663 [Athelia psychrophila]|uniref:BTB domain-containing protein n=1 Tax=Athelia psychrophila TaxID=1759441 RepID=A0A166EY36_9AGAM|nr:hypothetical protein FIBSPDRAFT_794663 [Fibularhizoctonia sp. CBS 109695]